MLRATWRLVVRPPTWCEVLPVAEATLSPQLVLPQLAGVLDRLKWSLTHNARHLCCIGPGGEARRVRIGFESFRTVLQWLTMAYRMRYVLQAGRVWRHKNRGPDAACGLLCPVPPRDAHYEFGGHKLVFQEARGDRNLSLAAFGAGCTNWFFNAKGEFLRGTCGISVGAGEPTRPDRTLCGVAATPRASAEASRCPQTVRLSVCLRNRCLRSPDLHRPLTSRRLRPSFVSSWSRC